MEGVEKMSTLDILLGADLPDMRKNLPEQKVEVPRLSQEAGKPVIFTLRALPFDKVREIQEKPGESRRSMPSCTAAWTPAGRIVG